MGSIPTTINPWTILLVGAGAWLIYELVQRGNKSNEKPPVTGGALKYPPNYPFKDTDQSLWNIRETLQVDDISRNWRVPDRPDIRQKFMLKFPGGSLAQVHTSWNTLKTKVWKQAVPNANPAPMWKDAGNGRWMLSDNVGKPGLGQKP